MLTIDKNKRGSGIIINDTMSPSSASVELVVGVDAGSTETRVCIADAKDSVMLLGETSDPTKVYDKLRTEVYIIPSTFAIVGDEREIKPNSDNLEDNYDSHIIRVSSGAVSPLVGSDRIVRGQKIADTSGLVLRYLDSSTNKMDNNIFYINVFDGIGYALLQKYSGRIPGRVSIHLVISVRPKELNSYCQDRMNQNFIGDYIFRWKTVTINMAVTDTIYTTEPEAQITGTTAIMDLAASLGDETAEKLSEKFNESDSYIHIEGGGSSIGVEVVKNGNIVDACSSTFQLGGNYLTRVILDRLREVKGRVVSEESARSAIQTCLLRNGREREDISEILSSCKNQVGLDILEKLRHAVIDITPDLSLLDMDFVTLGGRLFRSDDSGCSIGTYFAEYLAQISPNTEVIVLADNYIPQGNLVIGINQYELNDGTPPVASSGRVTPLSDLSASGSNRESKKGQVTELARVSSDDASELDSAENS